MRTPEYDRDAVLCRAMATFREKGYAATTMQDLVAATGLHPGSLYAAFGNKHGLLLAALERYDQEQAQRTEACFAGVSPLTGLRRFFAGVAAESACTEPSTACLVAKVASELGQDPEIQARSRATLGRLEARFAEALEAARAEGELSAVANAQDLARWLMVGLQGLRAYAYGRPGPEALNAIVAQLFQSLPLA
ncbi:MAG: TetR/AcrR family transcriptional regulator [Gammaproteobacteria bacterium]|nr:TetR/AcrR family transcriptional regulator [Gammaproteobacteria bacterium]